MTEVALSVLDSPNVREGINIARNQVAVDVKKDPSEIYYRLMFSDDWSAFINGAGTTFTLSKTQGTFTYAAGFNTFDLKSVGDRFVKLLAVGMVETGLEGLVTSIELDTNNNRVKFYQGAFLASSANGLLIFGDSPLIVDQHCSFQFIIQVAAGFVGVTTVRAFPIMIVFPICG